MSVLEKIKHYQRHIQKCDGDKDRILHCISRLYNLPVTVQHLQETGVGRTVNGLRKYGGTVGDAARACVGKWKMMVVDEETSGGEDEDEACVPDASESYNDGRKSPTPEETSIRYKNEVCAIYGNKSEKTEASYDNKYVSKQEFKVKSQSVESHSKGGNTDSAKNFSNDLEKEKKHEKNKYKHESRSDRKSSKDTKSASKKHEGQSYKHHGCSKSDNVEKCPSKSIDINLSQSSEVTYKKRKNDDPMLKESKRRKESESDSDEGKTSTFQKYNSNNTLNKAKDDTIEKNVTITIEINQDFHEKSKGCSSKHRTNSISSKSKSLEHKHKIEIQPSCSKDESKKIDHHSKSKDKSMNRDKQEKSKSEHKSSKDLKHSKHGSKESKDLTKMKQRINGDEGIDCHSGASFAEALGMCTMAPPSKKRTLNNNTSNTNSAKVNKPEQSSININKPVIKVEPTTDSLQIPSLLSSNVKLQPLSVDLASTLPEISPNYKPLPYVNANVAHRKEEDKILSHVMHVKNQRTKVYSGNKTGLSSVPTLFKICQEVLIENIDALEFTGGVPYDILKPVLERATPDQLFMLEHHNPYLIDDTDELWEYHCKHEFRTKQRESMETWREMYMRCLDEREAKLKRLTANIKRSIDKSLPARSTKLAYVDNIVKPPRNILKKQAKYGTASAVPIPVSSGIKKKLISGGGSAAATNISVPPPPMSRAKPMKKTKAPLMAKALQLIKGRYKR